MSISITNYLKYRVMHHEKQIKDLIQNASEHYQNMRKKMWRKSKILKLHTTIKFLIQNTINQLQCSNETQRSNQESSSVFSITYNQVHTIYSFK